MGLDVEMGGGRGGRGGGGDGGGAEAAGGVALEETAEEGLSVGGKALAVSLGRELEGLAKDLRVWVGGWVGGYLVERSEEDE